MEDVSPVFYMLIYAVMALPLVLAILVGVMLVVALICYFTNRRKTALKILKISGITTIVLLAFAWVTKSSLGL